MKNPYSKYIVDDASGIAFRNELYEVWQEGFNACMKSEKTGTEYRRSPSANEAHNLGGVSYRSN